MGEHADRSGPRRRLYRYRRWRHSDKVDRLIRDTRTQAAITEDARRRFEGMVPAAPQAAQEMIAKPSHRDRAKGAFGVLNRAGLHEVSEEQHAQEVMLTGTEKIAKIHEPAATLNLEA